jgi:citrate lyase subunit beta / citryl-CoA lyase
MAHRSWLLVPAGSEKKLSKATTAGADVVVLDLLVGSDLKSLARENARDWLLAHRFQVVEGRRFSRWVRIDGLETPYWREDLVAVMAGGPDGIVLPHAAGPEAVQQLAAEIYELEQRNQMAPGSLKIVPQVADSARAASSIGAYLETGHPRLAGLAWSGGALAEALGATRTHDAAGGWTDACRHVRAQTLLAAHARGVMALELMDSPDADADGLAQAAHADGFSGMVAVHPAQVAAINRAYGAPVAAANPARRAALVSV